MRDDDDLQRPDGLRVEAYAPAHAAAWDALVAASVNGPFVFVRSFLN